MSVVGEAQSFTAADTMCRAYCPMSFVGESDCSAQSAEQWQVSEHDGHPKEWTFLSMADIQKNGTRKSLLALKHLKTALEL
jgi:hypothetical protein